MKVHVAKTAGFCYGVGRAVEHTFALIRQGVPNLYTFGELIHNRDVTQSLLKNGVRVANRVEEIPKDAHVIIRAHGVSQSVTDARGGKRRQPVDCRRARTSRGGGNCRVFPV